MEATLFFPKTVHREVRIRSLALLVGKPPELSKRIKLLVSMPLSGKAAVGMPGWLADAWEFVEKTKDNVTQKDTQFGAVNLEFSGDDLFSKPVKAPKSQLNKFAVVSVGDKEEPDTELEFVAYAPFSKTLLEWCGQFSGHDIWANFDLIGEATVPKSSANGSEPTADEQELFAEDAELMKPEHDEEFSFKGAKNGSAKPAKKKGKTK